MDADLTPIMVCPSCRSHLEANDSNLVCSACGTGYLEIEGLLDFLPTDADPLKKSERDHYTEKVTYYLQMHKAWCRSPFYRHFHRNFLDELCRLPRGSLILELGCGLGHDGAELLRSGYRLVETDIAPGQLLEARKLHEREGLSSESIYLLVDAERLPFRDGVFDGVFMVATLHHLPHPLQSLKEIHRVLKPKGLLVLGTEPNTWQHRTIYPLGGRLLRLMRARTRDKEDISERVSQADQQTEGFSAKDLEGLFREAGFSRWELKPAGYLSAALFFIATEGSQILQRDIRFFALERLTIPIDEALGRLPWLRRYPWHWNATAHKPG